MKTAVLVGEDLRQFCPTTNHYRCSDGSYLLVTVKDASALRKIHARLGLGIPIAVSHAPSGTDVFRADENAAVLDADGDPSNGMTALLELPDATSFTAALRAVGYELLPGEGAEGGESSGDEGSADGG